MYKSIKKIVFCAMSGGVDSSVAAFLLKRQGHDVVGIFMRCFNLDGCQDRDAEDARRVAAKIGIPFYVWDFEEEYKKRVVEYMINGYKQGITPNPDVMCNREIKFGLFFDRAQEMGADYVATGHYVRKSQIANRKSPNDVRYALCAARDSNKDQSYFLWTLTQDKLRYCLFPVGDYLKSEIREIARKAGLPTAEKKDSQGICFLGKVTLADFLGSYIPPKQGVVLNSFGDKIGEHNGAHFYTVGQRHGLASGDWQLATSRKSRQPVYVAEKDIETNTLVVTEGYDNPALYKKELELTEINFLSPETMSLISAEGGRVRQPVSGGNSRINVLARVRYRQPLTKAVLSCNKSSVISYKLIFDHPVKFIALGQSAVFYKYDGLRSADGFDSNEADAGRELFGGGVIQKVL